MCITEHKLIVKDLLGSVRADAAISEALKISRSSLKSRFCEKHILINGKKKSLSTKVKNSDELEFKLNEVKGISLEPEDIPLDIIYEDGDIIAVNKQAGLVVHAGGGTRSNTLVNGLLYHLKNWNNFKDSVRPGIVHRLDKETSGVMIVAKTEQALKSVQMQFAARKVIKEYRALIHPSLKINDILIEKSIGRHSKDRKKMEISGINAKEASTEIKVIKNYKSCSYISAFPKTGRTHQIRVHLASIMHPILGDKKYSGKNLVPQASKKTDRQMLHAHKITFIHPSSGNKLELTAPLPFDFNEYLDYLEQIERQKIQN